MARGRAKRHGKLVGCCGDGVPPCDDVQEPDDTIAEALRDITQFIEKRLADADLPVQLYQLRAVERTNDGDLIEVRLVPLGPGKLTLVASVAAGVVTLGVLTGAVGASPAEESGVRKPEDVTRLTSEYREGLLATCRASEAKLVRQRAANPDALPIEDLVDVLQAQLDQVQQLTPPAALAGRHTELVAATRDRIVLLSKIVADDQATGEQVTALLDQSDVSATQANEAFRALGVDECVR